MRLVRDDDAPIWNIAVPPAVELGRLGAPLLCQSLDFLTETPIALSIREREEMPWGQDASKSGKVIKREKIDFISRRKTSGCDRTRLSKARKKGAWKRAAPTCLFSRTGSLHGDPPRTKLFHHPIAAALLHPQCSMIESQLRPRWRLRITCQRTARG